MKLDVLTSILTEQKSVRREGHVFQIDESLEATVFFGASGDLLSVPRIVRIELGKEYCSFTTAKGERYFLPAELVLALKLEVGEEKRKSTGGSAGFR